MESNRDGGQRGLLTPVKTVKPRWKYSNRAGTRIYKIETEYRCSSKLTNLNDNVTCKYVLWISKLLFIEPKHA